VNGSRCLIGNRLLMNDQGVAVDLLDHHAVRLAGEGKTVVYVAMEKRLSALLLWRMCRKRPQSRP